jgi:signal-transduction protein with cAMP-binding, CBS, and nucleotidyltransferase domain
VQIPLTSMEQLLPFPTAEELIAKHRNAVGSPGGGHIVSVPPHATVLAALQCMAENHVGFLPVIENGTLAGVLSERDCARRMVLHQLAAENTAVREIMTTRVYSVPSQTKLPECVMLMHEKEIRHLPVMRGNEILGVLSVREVMGALIERYERLQRRLLEERLTLLYPDPSSY